jgi:hypothetical protein
LFKHLIKTLNILLTKSFFTMKTIRNFLSVLAVTLIFGISGVFAQTAKVQLIHNSADALSQRVDIYVNGDKLIENFQFRTATEFIEVPANADLKVTVTPGFGTPSTSFEWNQVLNLQRDETYILITNGLVDENRYSPFVPFDVYAYAGARTEAAGDTSSDEKGNTDVLVFHGATDAPNVNVVESGVGAGTIISNFGYGEFSGYLSLPTRDYTLQITDITQRIVVAEYAAPLRTLGLEGQALTVLASGFLNPEDNNNDPEFGLWVALASGGDLIPLPEIKEDPGVDVTANVVTPSSFIQLIHNSADQMSSVVDVYVNGLKFLSDVTFRSATPFVEVPAGVDLKVTVVSKTSDNVNSLAYNQAVNFQRDENYILVANGLADQDRYTPFEPFSIYAFGGARMEAIADESSENATGTTDVLVFHGATDAPAVNVVESGVGAGTIISEFAYGDFAGYLSLPTADYILQIKDVSETVVVAEYSAPLRSLGLEGQALTVLASGFLNPSDNADGPAFGLYVALASGGDLIPLPTTETENKATARVQVIHNSADAAAASVDVWLNDTKLLADFAFRTASPFVDAPAGEEFTIAIQAPGSTSPDNPIWSQNYTLEADETYILVANGIVSASGYDPVQPFDIYVEAMGREAATNSDETDVLVFHGSTDAPTVSVWETAVVNGELFSFSYGEFAGYLELPTLDFILEVRDETGTTTVAAYQAPLATLGLEGAALSVMASGFLNPANNSNGEAFGLFVALADGGDLIPLPLVEPQGPARVQVIHNSADAAAASVDVWLNDTKLLADFAFRTASPFVDAPAGEEFTIAIQAPGSTSPDNPIWSQNYTLEADETYILVANGIVSASGYDPVQPFDIYVEAMGREAATNSDETDVLVFHGSTDAPTVSVWETAVVNGELFSFSYGEFAGYLELPTLDFILEVRDETGTTTVAAYQAPLATLGLEGAALSVMASGFLNPANNSNGEAFGLFVALADGGDLNPACRWSSHKDLPACR